MASMPGILTDWPWKPLGSFKYLIMAPWVIHSTMLFMMNDGKDRDIAYILIFPLMLWRMIHNQIWITLSRYRTAKGNGRILDKGLEFDQVDRERNWDDQILFNGTLMYLSNRLFSGAQNVPLWRTDGVVATILLHAGPVEYLYYWFHRALHHHYLYSRYHSHHHSSIVTEPITSVIHPFAEHIVYSLLFSIPMLATVFMGTASVISLVGYHTYIDFMNNMGHCNFELIPNCLFSLFPPLKYLMYTPSFHSLHHTQFRTNYSLFMPFYDYVYGTMDNSTDSLYETSLKREEESPDILHLTHLTTPESIYHLPLGFASLASIPHTPKWYLWLMWPVTLWYMVLTRICGRTFVVERQRFNKLRLQTWVIPKYTLQYNFRFQKEAINCLIEEAIVQAEKKGVKVISLGLLNQGEDLNRYGGLYVQRHPHLKIKVVDGSSLAVAVILNSIPKGTTQVVFRGNLTKVAYALAFALYQKGIQVATLHEDEYLKLTKSLSATESSLVLAESYAHKIWLVGDGLTEKEQLSAPRGTLFVPFSQLPPKKLRKDCFYHYTPAMKIPSSLENIYSCENWLPRRVMSAWRIAGIVHALEGWKEHECGYTMSDTDKVWQASLRHGFHPLVTTQPM
ncbi:very-long-chain aldehyde decarbonylase CER1-like [Malus domestica]|uniref:very-long-chain aldehyde decarbonylase CER1-like n=1 Tax=Malus domestica TaxID=3750 RepID=UPI0004988950|nr:very-long-chain aldehyde decarbonylase CER1-like isoform X2 [Malus domestica]